MVADRPVALGSCAGTDSLEGKVCVGDNDVG